MARLLCTALCLQSVIVMSQALDGKAEPSAAPVVDLAEDIPVWNWSGVVQHYIPKKPTQPPNAYKILSNALEAQADVLLDIAKEAEIEGDPNAARLITEAENRRVVAMEFDGLAIHLDASPIDAAPRSASLQTTSVDAKFTRIGKFSIAVSFMLAAVVIPTYMQKMCRHRCMPETLSSPLISVV